MKGLRTQPSLLGGIPLRFSRFEALVGAPTAAAIAKKTVLVAGIGGVGSFVCEALARSGLGTLVLADFDVVDPTNANRQLWALTSTFGKKKVDVAKARLLDINPDLRVETRDFRIGPETISACFDPRPDYVCDAVDDLDAKILLVQEARRRGIPVVSAMGFARKRHPERIRPGLLKDTSVDPLAKAMRSRMRAEGMELDLPVVWTDEPPEAALRPSSGLPSAPTVPSAAGLILAAQILNHFIDIETEVQKP